MDLSIWMGLYDPFEESIYEGLKMLKIMIWGIMVWGIMIWVINDDEERRKRIGREEEVDGVGRTYDKANAGIFAEPPWITLLY